MRSVLKATISCISKLTISPTRPMGPSVLPAKNFLWILHISSTKLESPPRCSCQCRIALWRTVFQNRLYRNQTKLILQAGRSILRKRGTAEQRIKEGKTILEWTRLFYHTFQDNEVRLKLSALVYNLDNFFQRLVLPRKIQHWTLTDSRGKVDQNWGKDSQAPPIHKFQLAEVAVPGTLFKSILLRIDYLRFLPETG